ncbi:MAG TPA: DinB family protein [Thermomicrobiaceae bacterium]|nr:DinB family protein [Thermomicrobiaceae bacterium]
MRLSDIKTLYAYDRWATGRILDAGRGLTQQQFTSPSPLGGPGVRQTLTHIVDSMRGWRLRWEGKPDEELRPEEFGALAALTERWRIEADALQTFLDSLAEDDLERPVRTLTLWQTLVHLANHGTQHRSEAAMLLTHYGHSPDDLDLSWYLRDFAPKDG